MTEIVPLLREQWTWFVLCSFERVDQNHSGAPG
jgi:hypothetical protein